MKQLLLSPCSFFTNLFLVITMRFLLFYFLIIATCKSIILAQNPINTWKAHLSYNEPTCLAQVNQSIVVGTTSSLFSYNTSNAEISTYSKVEGYTDLNITAINYDNLTNKLLIAYNSAVLNIVQNNKIKKIIDISDASITGSKKIHNIYFFKNFAYLACDFGIVKYDMQNEETKETYIIGENGNNMPVYQVAIGNNYIAAATKNGIYYANLNNQNLANSNSWQQTSNLPTNKATGIVFNNNSFYIAIESSLYAGNFDTSFTTILNQPNWIIQSLTLLNNKIAIPQWYQSNGNISAAKVTLIDENQTAKVFEYDKFGRPQQAFIDSQNILWVVDTWQGLLKFETNNNIQKILPNCPRTNDVYDIAIDNNEVWVTPGGIQGAWAPATNRGGVFRYKDGQWINYYYYSQPAMPYNSYDILNIVKHPNNNKWYMATFGFGVFEFDETYFNIFNQYNSTLKPTLYGNDTSNFVQTTGIVFDKQQNMWVLNTQIQSTPLSVRLANNEWHAFPFPQNFNYGNYTALVSPVIDDAGQIWFGVITAGVAVYNPGQNIESPDDDTFIQLTKEAHNLPSNQVKCLTKDRDGYIWVGTADGIGIFYCPTSIISNPCFAEKPYVEVDGFGAYLLQSESVLSIAVDGANRKWVGTENGLFLFSPDGTKQIQHFTAQNSPLLNNSIVSLNINQLTGELWIGTQQGLMSYQTDATKADNNYQSIIVYPNPVKPDFNGLLAIKGLPQDATVKITDISGTLIYETKALGGQAVWDLKNYNGVKAATGVYLIFSNNFDGSEKKVNKVVIIN